MTGELKHPNRCRHLSALGLLVPPTFFFFFSFLSPEYLLYHPNLSAAVLTKTRYGQNCFVSECAGAGEDTG